MGLLLSASDMPATSLVGVFAKPVVYVVAFAVYAAILKGRAHWTKPLLAGAVRTALGFALGTVTLVLVTALPAPAILLVLTLCRFGLWYGLARLFFPSGSGRGAFLFAIAGVALNLAIDWTLFGGAVGSAA